jgi:hypothetical protein
VRWIGLLALVAIAAADPFTPPPERFGRTTPGAYGRYVESLALLKAVLARDPAHVLALERAITLLERFSLSPGLIDTIRAALRRADLEPRHRAALRGLLGRVLVAKARGGGGAAIVIVGRPPQRRRLAPETQRLYLEAVGHLREAIRHDPRAARARSDLALALEALDATANAAEIRRLRTEAAALSISRTRPRPQPVRHDLEAEKLRASAEALEQRPARPDHAAALLLRKRALVLDYCAYTIPFAYEAPVYGPVTLLADRRLVTRNLTRSYVTLAGDVGQVPPRYYPAPAKKKLQIVQDLARDRSANAAAVLLRLVATAQPGDPMGRSARDLLAAGDHAAVAAQLPRLLDTALFSTDQGHYTLEGQRWLVSLAGALAVKEAAPVLAGYLEEDTHLDWPRGVATALGAIGRPADAEVLLARARDPRCDVYFRREAIRALGRLAPARLDDVPAEAHLELALAAARYARAPSEALKGRLLAGLDRLHEADDAGRYCLELDLFEAIPQLERFLAAHKDHYAAGEIRDALRALQTRARRTR